MITVLAAIVVVLVLIGGFVLAIYALCVPVDYRMSAEWRAAKRVQDTIDRLRRGGGL